MNFNEQISVELPNEFGGSDRKKTVILANKDRKYLLKLPDPTREKGKKEELSYINNVFSEYIGCMIAKSIGIPVQDVVLGEYTFENSGKTVPACACEDIRRGNEILYEIDKQELSNFMDGRGSKETTFESANEMFSTLKKYGLDEKEDTNPETDYYAFYQKNIQCIKDIPEFVSHLANISGKNFRVMRVSSQCAITFDDTGATSIFSLQSNDSKVKRTMEIFRYLGANEGREAYEEYLEKIEEDHEEDIEDEMDKGSCESKNKLDLDTFLEQEKYDPNIGRVGVDPSNGNYVAAKGKDSHDDYGDR